MSSYVKKSWRSYQENKVARKRSEEIDHKLKLQQVWARSNTRNQILLFGKKSIMLLLYTACTREITDSFIERMLLLADQRRDYSSDYVCAMVFSLVELLVMAMSNLKLAYSSKRVKLCGQLLLETKRTARHNISEEQKVDIRIFWSDQGVQDCFKQLVDFIPSLEAMRYCLDNLDLISSGHCIFTEEEFQRFHTTLTGVKQYSVLVNCVAFKITDATDLLSGRKTRHYFAEETVLFVCQIDRYIEVLSEEGDKTDNQLSRSLTILKGLMSVRYKGFTGIIVFFLNSDNFIANLSEYDLREYFPAYQGAQQDAVAAKSFIADLFQPSHDHSVWFYHHFIDQDTNMFQELYRTTRDLTQRQHLERYRLL